MKTQVLVKRRRDPVPVYSVVIGSSYSHAESAIANSRRYDRIFLISDTTVMRLYGRKFARRLSGRGREIGTFSFPPGEHSKSRAMKFRLEDRLLKAGVTRSSLLLAMGGGVTGDLTGFIAATLLRGVPYIHLPTTLLAQVDSSVGGKVGVNHPLGKNLIGAFYPPEAVYINTAVLDSLPEKEYRAGLAEVIKYAAILDRSLFGLLRRHHRGVMNRNGVLLRKIVKRCCELKAGVVLRDERDTGHRRILNFGHTVGHALEHASRYAIPHGYAVALGMAAEAGLSREKGFLPQPELDALLQLLDLFELPVEIPRSIPRVRVLTALRHDKKKSHDEIGYTLLRRIGKAVAGVPLPDRVLRELLGP